MMNSVGPLLMSAATGFGTTATNGEGDEAKGIVASEVAKEEERYITIAK